MDKQKLSYFGHVIRADGLEKTIMLGMGEGKRRRGRPRMRWLDGVREMTGCGLGRLRELALDRGRWRKIVSNRSSEPELRAEGTR